MTVRIGVIGCGAIGSAHAAAAAAADGCSLVAVADADPAAAARVAADHGARVVEQARLADRDAVDLVVVATPPATHLPVVEPLLRAGVAVMCEKPLEAGPAAARELAAVAQDSGTLLTMASKFRFVDDVLRTRELIADGALGDVVKVEIAFAGVTDMATRWNADRSVSGGGALIDNAVHGADLARYLVGPLTRVVAAAGPAVQPVAVEDSATLLARTAAGPLVQIDVTWSFRRLAGAYLTVLGSRGTVEVGWDGARLARGDAAPEAFGSGYRKDRCLGANIAAVAAELGGRPQARLARAADALAAAEVVDAGYRSLAGGGWVTVEEHR